MTSLLKRKIQVICQTLKAFLAQAFSLMPPSRSFWHSKFLFQQIACPVYYFTLWIVGSIIPLPGSLSSSWTPSLYPIPVLSAWALTSAPNGFPATRLEVNSPPSVPICLTSQQHCLFVSFRSLWFQLFFSIQSLSVSTDWALCFLL